MRANMRPRMMVTLILAASLFAFAPASFAQGQMQNMQMPSNSDSGQQRSSKPVPGDHASGMGGGMMSPDMMQMMGPMMQMQGPGGHGHDADGPLQGISRFMKAIDDPQTRASLGITDAQADSLRKIVVDTETFTITNVASIAVDSIQLKELLRADKPDKAEVMSKGDEISKATSGLISHYLEACLSAKAILSPEQQKALRAYMENGAPPMATPMHQH
jgi:hypothetical protein